MYVYVFWVFKFLVSLMILSYIFLSYVITSDVSNKDLVLFLLERQNYRVTNKKRWRDVLFSGSFPSRLSNWKWAGPKPGPRVRSLFGVSHVGRGPSAISCCFPRPVARTSEREQPGLEPASRSDSGNLARSLVTTSSCCLLTEYLDIVIILVPLHHLLI